MVRPLSGELVAFGHIDLARPLFLGIDLQDVDDLIDGVINPFRAPAEMGARHAFGPAVIVGGPMELRRLFAKVKQHS
jgi:hypothetical protein